MRFRLLFYSILLSGVAFVLFAFGASDIPLSGSRTAQVAASIAVLEKGGPPLLASDVPYDPGVSVDHLRPVGVSDDQGIYLYLPLLAKITGEDDPPVLMKWLFAGCFALLVLAYPLIFGELFGSIGLAVAAPILAVLEFGFTARLEHYWILAWCMLLGIPGLVLAYQWWSRHRRRAAVVLLGALMTVASFSTSIRSQAGLPILLGALGIALVGGTSLRRVRHFWRFRRWWVRPAVAAGLVAAYLSIATLGFAAVRAYRNHVIHQPSFGSARPTHHPFWHSAYLGLGYLPNRYGIEYHDAAGLDAVERTQPGTGYLTKEYDTTLRHKYLQIARNDPGFVLRNFWSKARTIIADAVWRFWPLMIMLPAALLVGPHRRSMRVALLVTIPAALYGALAPVLTVPIIAYQLEWLGSWGALFLLALGSLWVTARGVGQPNWRVTLALWRGRPLPVALRALRARVIAAPPARAAFGGAVLALFLLAAARPAGPANSEALYASEQPATVDPNLLERRGLRSWSFGSDLPRGWRTVGGAFIQPDTGGLYVRSPMTTVKDQLIGPWFDVRAGSYDVVTLCRSLVGGFQVSVRKPDGSPVAASGYSWHQADVAREAMKVSFTTDAATRLRVIISSWSSVPNASAWIVFQMKLLQAERAHR